MQKEILRKKLFIGREDAECDSYYEFTVLVDGNYAGDWLDGLVGLDLHIERLVDGAEKDYVFANISDDGELFVFYDDDIINGMATTYLLNQNGRDWVQLMLDSIKRELKVEFPTYF